jgi:hypothetical protein
LLFTVAEIADKLKLDTDTVRRLFGNEPGVIVFCSPASRKRRYRTLRVPAPILLRVLTRLTSEYRWRLEDLERPVFTVDEIAKRLKLAPETVRRLLARAAGVMVICFPMPGKRTYRTLRTPDRALADILARLTWHDGVGSHKCAAGGSAASNRCRASTGGTQSIQSISLQTQNSTP